MSQRKQAHISSFFTQSQRTSTSKRRAPAAFPVDLTSGGSDGESSLPPSKRQKTSDAGSPLPQGSAPPVVAGPVLRKYGYIRGDAPETTPRTTAQQARHEKFKKRLLLDDGALLPNPPMCGAEGGTGVDDNTLDPLDATHESESEPDQESDDQFKELQERFANKGRKGKQPVPSPKKRTKRVVEVGPSGQPYTPLELQVGWSDLSLQSRYSNGHYFFSRFVSSRRITLERCSWSKLATSSSFSVMTQR